MATGGKRSYGEAVAWSALCQTQRTVTSFSTELTMSGEKTCLQIDLSELPRNVRVKLLGAIHEHFNHQKQKSIKVRCSARTGFSRNLNANVQQRKEGNHS